MKHKTRIQVYVLLSIFTVSQLLIINEAHKLKEVYIQIPVPQYIKKKHWVKSEVIEMVKAKAIENNINPKYLLELGKCESSLDHKMQSRFIQPYGREESFGLFQIHLRAHKDITVEQAIDPVFNTNWTIREIKKGKAAQHWVTCHKKALSVL